MIETVRSAADGALQLVAGMGLGMVVVLTPPSTTFNGDTFGASLADPAPASYSFVGTRESYTDQEIAASQNREPADHRIRQTDQKLLLTGKPTPPLPADAEITSEWSMTLNGAHWSIVTVSPLAPGAAAILYEIQARR